MYRLFDKLKPAFFKAWDQKLLLNRPALWATKFHYALIFGGLGLALSSLTVWFMPVDVTALPNAWLHLLYAGIPSAIALAIWIWQVSLFKTDKAFGEAGTKTALRDQMIYALVGLIAIGLPALHNYRVSEKVGQAISDQSMVEDINHLNLMAGFTTNYGTYYDAEQTPAPLEERLDYYSFTYYSVSVTGFENVKSADHNRTRFMYLSRIYKRKEALVNLAKYIELVDKYSDIRFAVSPEMIYEAFDRVNKEGGSIELPEKFEMAEAQADDNLELLQRAKLGRTHLFSGDRWKAPLLLFLWGFTLLLIGLQTSGRTILFSAILGGALIFGAAISSEFLRHFIELRGDIWMSLIYLGLIALFSGFLLFGRKTSQRGLLWRKMILSLFVVGLVFVPFCSWILAYEFSESFRAWESALNNRGQWLDEYMLFIGATLPLLFWNLGIRQAFMRLHVRPKSR